jgi:adenine-specific DNA-methyltransferase
MAKEPKTRRVETLVHDKARRKNIPTAELQTFLDAEEDAKQFGPVSYKRAWPLAEGETRARDEDRDPQLIWNGVRIRLTQGQVRQLAETGEVAIGDAQLVWRGKDTQDWSDLIVQAPPLYIQEKIHPKAIIDDLKKHSSPLRGGGAGEAGGGGQLDLFADFNGVAPDARAEFYQHDAHWSNRMILGDSLQVMASLAERESLRGKVQCIYFDPPYGIKFNSNWQVSTESRDVKDGKREDISREPEQVKAFRDTWKDGIHSYLTYLRDRLTVARELLTESGSIFVQIGDENVHRVRAVMDEVFGVDNHVSTITVQKTYGFSADAISNVSDYLVWYARRRPSLKSRQLYTEKPYVLGEGNASWVLLDDFSYRGVTAREKGGLDRLPDGAEPYNPDNLVSQGRAALPQPLTLQGVTYDPYTKNSHWKPNYPIGMERLVRSSRVHVAEGSFRYRRFHKDFGALPFANIWTDTGTGNFTDEKIYVVQTGAKTVQRCLLMATDPGDLVLDPTCGSGTTAYVAEQWGRRWVTIDTSRVALALARTRLMSARYPYYLLADSREGRAKEQDITGRPAPEGPTHGDIRQGFVYERVPHVTLKSIANNAEIDVIWERWQQTLEPLREKLNNSLPRSGEGQAGAAGQGGGRGRIPPPGPPPGAARHPPHKGEGAPAHEGEGTPAHRGEGKGYEEWEIPREADPAWPEEARAAHAAWWEARIARQREIDASIARAADVELLYDRPYEDKSRVRVAGPFTVESLSPHRVIPADQQDNAEELAPAAAKRRRALEAAPPTDFAAMVLENLRTAGVQGRDKADRVRFTALQPWPGRWIGGEGTYLEGPDGKQVERRAAIFIGPEFGTLSRPDLVAAAREAADARFDLLVACAFAYDAHASDLTRLGPLNILQAKMNPDLHMADDLKNTGKGNLFVVFGEPDIDIERLDDDQLRVRVKGIDVFDPNTGEIRADDVKGIAAWFIDTDYDEESFFVRHAYFLGANDPYKALKTSLKAEIDEAAWASLYRDISRPFPRPASGRIAVKVINHFGDEVMKVYGV